MNAHFFIIFITFASLFSCKFERDADASQMNKITLDSSAYLQLGDEITALSQATLLKNVSAAMKSGGPKYAIEFCSAEAMPILDSLSQAHRANIQRISLRNRNPENGPKTSTERIILETYDVDNQNALTLKPLISESNDHISYFKPIKIGIPACLKCHGMPEADIDVSTLAKINELYPEDKAIGYKMGELRGAWKVTFEKLP
ncbi:MAG: DUF3365 domain-containing protein, partial [Saprospiraceae bacterium]|nr:DUF3365 domain-containing protein [Saprospiraceae bacterium]